MNRFKTTVQERFALEKYYAHCGVRKDAKSRLCHFQQSYGEELYIATYPPFASDEEELGAWEYIILGVLHILDTQISFG